MMIGHVLVLAAVLTSGAAPAQKAAAPAVGILPFDVAAVRGAPREAGEGLARLVRIELIRVKAATPVFLERPAARRAPIAQAEAARIGSIAGVPLVLVGTVLDVETNRSRRAVRTRGLGDRLGVRGQVGRTAARVALHVELVESATGASVHAFEVEASESDVGVGADVWSVLGRLDLDDDRLLQAPMGKALREAAEKIASEVVRYASTAVRR